MLVKVGGRVQIVSCLRGVKIMEKQEGFIRQYVEWYIVFAIIFELGKDIIIIRTSIIIKRRYPSSKTCLFVCILLSFTLNYFRL